MSHKWLVFLVHGITVASTRNAYFSSQSQITPEYCLHNNFTLHEVTLLFCAFSCVMSDGCRDVAYTPTTQTCMGCQYVMDQDYSRFGFNDSYDVPVEIPANSTLYSPDASSYRYIGCYADCMIDLIHGSPCFSLALPQLNSFDNSLTTNRCFEICQQYGSRYFGTQDRIACLCGLVYDKFGPTDRCDMSCGGNNSQTCGGPYANSVYEILLLD